jgi:hypothetical protein
MIKQDDDGTWFVTTDDGEVLASGLSNAEAWEFVDSRNGMASSDAETHRRVVHAFEGEG